MKTIAMVLVVIGLLFTVAKMANAASNQPLITLLNAYQKEVHIALRTNHQSMGDSCIAPLTLHPKQQVTIYEEELFADCKSANTYILDITHWVTHSFILKNKPTQCKIYAKKWHVLTADCR